MNFVGDDVGKFPFIFSGKGEKGHTHPHLISIFSISIGAWVSFVMRCELDSI